MNLPPLDESTVRAIVSQALQEDIGHIDLTSTALIDASVQADAQIFAEEDGILAGINVAKTVFLEINPHIQVQVLKQDGDSLKKGDAVLQVHANARDLLAAERTALNFLQHLSGIATQTARFVAKAKNTTILDTRKTTPGLRLLEKYAVLCGGGQNYRRGLFDEFLIKDNHFTLLKGKVDLQYAISQARAFNHKAKLTVEAHTLEQVKELIELNVDQISLKDMTDSQMAEAVRMVAGRCRTEASGNITLEKIPSIVETGVDCISVGALTNSSQALNFTMKIMEK